MTQDEIIEMYKEVSNKLCNGKEWCWAGVGEPLQLFAKLVAAKERDRCCSIIYGQCGSDNVAERTVQAIRGKKCSS